MKRFLLKFLRPPKIILGFLPSKIPTGMKAFDQFCKDIFFTYNFPDYPSYRQAIATMIMHLSPTTIRKPKRFFALGVTKSQANQIAYENIQLLKEEEKKTEATLKETPVESEGL